MILKEYQRMYMDSSKLHADNIMKYGPMAPFGVPTPQPEQLKRIEFIVSHVEGEILDIGCDSGYILSKCGGGTGIDISILRLKAAKHWSFFLSFVQALAESLPFRQVFDTVIAAEVLEHVLDPEKVLAEVYKVLKPGGKLIVTVPDEINGKSHMNPEHLRKFLVIELMKILMLQHFDFEMPKYIEGDYPVWCFCCRRN